jgi:hypothetical protein
MRAAKMRAILAAARKALHTPVWGSASSPRPTRRDGQRGFAYMLALIAILIMIASTLAIFEAGAVKARRNREDEMIWRGKQYTRAIRLYYHKTGKYPQTIDDLVKGLPQLHFLRQQYKDPTNKSDGAWRFIYVNAAGSIIGSTKYATLQQMQLLDMNGGVMPVIPGQPGVSASSLATGPQPGDINSGSGTGSSFSSFSSGGVNNNSGSPNGANGNGGNGTSQDGSNNGGQNGGQNGGSNITGDPNSNGQNPAGAPSSNGGGDPSQNNGQSGTQNGSQTGNQPGSQFGAQTPSSGSGMFGPALGGTSANGAAGAPGLASLPGANGQMNLAALAQLKPTGPVDGPVLGGFLTGVAGKTDATSIKRYHGAKKLNQFEFIWNPLEDAAAALQNQMSNMGGSTLGTGMAGTNPSSTSPNGSSPFGGSGSSPFGNNPSPSPTQNPQQPSQTPPQ